jgi:IS30 family transposase
LFSLIDYAGERPSEEAKEFRTLGTGYGGLQQGKESCLCRDIHRAQHAPVSGYKDAGPYSSFDIAFGVAAGQFPQVTFETAVDQGKEFACHAALETCHGLSVYFADPYCSWQRGSNETGNGLLREFFPKGQDFAEVTDEELAHALNLINHRPRKCLS